MTDQFESPHRSEYEPGFERAGSVADVRSIIPQFIPFGNSLDGERSSESVTVSLHQLLCVRMPVHDSRVASKVLGSRMHNVVCAPLERILQRRRSERRINCELPSDRVSSSSVYERGQESWRKTAEERRTMCDVSTFPGRVQRRLEPAQQLLLARTEGVVVVEGDDSLCRKDANQQLLQIRGYERTTLPRILWYAMRVPCTKP